MTVDTRRRILVTDTPAVSAMIQRNAHPNEPRSATLMRLAQLGDHMLSQGSPLPVFSGLKPEYRAMDATEILASIHDEDDADHAHG